MASTKDDDERLPDDIDLAPDSDGWDDVEDDVEDLALQCLFCNSVQSDLRAFVMHGTTKHDFDIVLLKNKLSLDFYGLIKLVNYVRSEVKSGRSPSLTDPPRWADDRYLQPVLEDDALLFSLDELALLNSSASDTLGNSDKTSPDSLVADLKAQLANLQTQFDVYREQVSQTLDKRWAESDAGPPRAAPAKDTYDNQYFEGYSSNYIHQVMLQDAIRTDAYRDFVYDNKHLFKDKVVLDVGCGTGILSMFCARAGARKVIAVDNSAIIDKARQIAADNDLLKSITFVRRKVEEIDVLPDGLSHVDIIISEWMGYCLFYEAMLPSVLVARDRFLKRSQDGKTFDGLIVPSHCSLQLAPMHDPEWTADNIAFWHDVYGFNMKCMLKKAADDVVVRFASNDAVCGKSATGKDLRVWDLYETKVEDLTFQSPFEITVQKGVDCLDSWCVWFDIGFSPVPPTMSKVSTIEEVAKQKGAVTFTTGPHGKQTHWQTGVCVIERDVKASSLAEGEIISGTLTYSKGQESRAVEIEIAWKTGSENAKQLWKMI